MAKKLRLGMVGAGMIAGIHLDACRDSRNLEFTAICDVDRTRAQALAREFGIPHVFASHKELLKADVCEAVSVCTPNNTHMPISVAAMAAGKDVLCEKPIAVNAREAKRMVDTAEKGGRVLMVAQSARYTGQAQLVKKLVEKGRLGDVYYGKSLWLRRTGIPRGWFQDRKQSAGGPLIDLGVHSIDLMWWLMGTPKPVSAYGITFDHLGTTGQGMGDWGVGWGKTKFSVEDMVGAMVRFEDDRALSIDISWAAHTGDLYWLRVFGTKGGAQLHPEPMLFEMEGKTKVDVVPQIAAQNPYTVENEHFAECVRKRMEPISSGKQALVIMQMLDAITKAAETGRMASIGPG
jgi:predicted dehydrogenase